MKNALVLDSINAEKASNSVIIPNSINGQQVFITSNILNPINTVVEEVIFQEGNKRVSNQYNTVLEMLLGLQMEIWLMLFLEILVVELLKLQILKSKGKYPKSCKYGWYFRVVTSPLLQKFLIL